MAAMLGASVGVLIHTTLVALGLSALLAASVTAFTILKVVGALYLLWLAIQTLRHGSALNIAASNGARPVEPLYRTWLTGLGVNLMNPKIIMFMVTFLPQFVTAGDPHAAQKLDLPRRRARGRRHGVHGSDDRLRRPSRLDAEAHAPHHARHRLAFRRNFLRLRRAPAFYAQPLIPRQGVTRVRQGTRGQPRRPAHLRQPPPPPV